MNANKLNILIIGGGASGMMAAITAAEQGANIQILERLPRVGKKLLATGNGHCNLSNLNSEMNHYHGNPDFIQLIFSQFDRNDTLELFENMGLSWIAESDFGRVFPRSMQASSVLDILRNAMAQRGITENCDATVQRIERTKHDFLIKLGGGDTLQADRVILAAGGRASPNMGSNGSGFTLAEQLGHSIRTPSPAIVQLIWDEPFSKSLKGLKIQASISLKSDGNELRSEIGEIHFMEDGLSGIPALQMARLVNESLEKEQIPVLHINLLPDLQSDDIHKQLMDRMDHFKNQPVQESLISLVHKRLIPVLLKEARIPCDTICSQLNESPVKSLMDALICWKIPVTGTRSWSSAQVTAGGIVTDEVYPSTLESKLVPGLYFAGEIMDVDGDCGGYNLQWAWSSGWVAGKSAADIS